MQRSAAIPSLLKILAALALSFFLLYSSTVRVALAQSTAPSAVILVPGTVSLDENVKEAISVALGSATSLYPGTTYFAVTDWRQDASWAVASVIGLSQLRSGGTWSVDDGSWVGIVLLHRSSSGAWQAATQGTKSFSSLLASVPNSFLGDTARRALDPLQMPAMQSQAASNFIFPLAPGTLMKYGGLGVHANGFSTVVSGWKAVDMMSDGDTTANHAPNRLIASETGTISYVCDDGTSVAVKMGDFFYTHLLHNDNLYVGFTFNQGDTMGSLKTGSFNHDCGYADQPSNWFHVHWGFPSGSLQIEDWTLSMTTGNWTNGTSTVAPGSWMLAGPTPPMPANLVQTSATQDTINFAWDSSPGADGYHLYSWNGTGYVLQDTLPATQTTYTEMRNTCGWSQNYKVSAYNYIGDSPRAGPLHAATIPCDPSPLSPANGSVNPWNYDVTLQSNPAAAASGYLMEYWGGPYTTSQTCGWSSTASCHVGILPPGSTYSWHVKARSVGGETAWSPTLTFTIQPLPCDTLTVAHTGSGSDPVPTPLNSAGCSAGQYHPTDTVSFTSAPDIGWTVGSWSGTDHNSSTSTSNTLTMPDGNTTSTVNYTPIVPGVPVLASPLNGATKQPINMTLSWNPASGAVSYEYCVSTSTLCTTWLSTGTNTSAALPKLGYGTLYYWWVRDTNVYGNSSVSAPWYFTTGSKPASFSKYSPVNGATAQPATALLQWAASTDASEYQVCIDTVNDDICQGDNWISTGTAQAADLTGQLSVVTTYYWQVRAINSFGVRYANGGWWAFTTSGVPRPFVKRGPPGLAVDVPVRPTFSWRASLYATSYEYCVDQTNDDACDGGNWIHLGAQTSVTSLAQLLPLTTYYWQVHALNGFGTATSDGDAWWSFTTGNPPAPFSKSLPVNGAVGQPLQLSLTWQPSSGATGYQYCLSKTNGLCSAWTDAGTSTSVSVSALSAYTTYYWQVRAANSIGIRWASGNVWWSFTTGHVPAAFSKLSPANWATNVTLSPTLTWQPSQYATTYDYCVSTSAPCAAWKNAGNVTSVAITGLKPGTQYYWQVRARNWIGGIAATGGYGRFRTGDVPADFSKSSPLNGAVNQSADTILAWAAGTGAVNYQVCIDTVADAVCQAQWVGTGAQRSVNVTSLGLLPNTTYYWQVRAVNSFGIRQANSGIWWSFTIQP